MRLTFLLALVGYTLLAQPPEDPLREALFPPESIMQHQQALGLSDDQKNTLKNDLRQAQVRFSELQWALEDAMERLVTLLKAPKVDEKAAAEQLDKVLNAEREVKRAQLMLLVRLKNSLSTAQQAQLRDLLQKSRTR